MYYVIHSKDPYLLARFCTELQMEGWEYPEQWAERDHHPFCDFYDDLGIEYKWLLLQADIKDIKAHNHACIDRDTRFTLTSRNYTKVLEAVLTNKTK